MDGDVGSKPVCRSRRSVNKIFAIGECLKQVIFNSEDVQEEKKKDCYNRLMEIYETAIKKNILIGGESWEQQEEDVTSEFEPIDVERERYFQQEVIQTLNDTMVEAVKKRKSCPRFIRKNMARYREANVHYYSKLKVEVPHKDYTPVVREATDIDEPISTLKNVSENLSDMNKTLLKEHARLARLQATIKIQSRVRRRQKTLLNTSLVQVEASTTPLKRKLDAMNIQDHTPVTKKPRFSERLAQKAISVHKNKCIGNK